MSTLDLAGKLNSMTEPGSEEEPHGAPLLDEVDAFERESLADASLPQSEPPPQPLARGEGLLIHPSYRPRRRSDVLELDMGDGAILYDNEARLIHHLNPSATLIWHLCDGSGSADDLARDIAEEYSLDPGRVGEQVRTVIAELDALGLVEDEG
jgi:PqqD family protein of HPr-rel-A system